MAARKRERSKNELVLIVPLDAAEVAGDEQGAQALKVAVVRGDEVLGTQTVRVQPGGGAEATFRFDAPQGEVRVLVGPEDAPDEDLVGLQTISASVSPRAWREPGELRLSPLRIAPFYWFWWRRWCRKFTIRGRVVCPDGDPVPGATVCAFDVDWWWWWASTQQVGCATTDVNGAFEITFTWCCGWWPWWWWRLRRWRLEPALVELVTDALPPPVAANLAAPTARPSLQLFEGMLAPDEVLQAEPAKTIDPGALEALRTQLVERFPVPPSQALHIWPWRPWRPWWDCTPDIIFRVTQQCHGDEELIVDEGYADTRWNIPNPLDVTLVASDAACCVDQPPGCDDGDCIVISHICNDLVEKVGGNVGAPAAPAGYRDPGVVATHGDRPYGGVVPISGQCGNQMDYYEFEWSDDGGGTWNDMPSAAAGAVTRTYFDSALLPGNPWVTLTFPFSLIDGRLVAESRAHYEATHDPLTWGTSRVWVGNAGILINWLTENNFSDGTYRLRLRAYDKPGATLENSRVLPLCGSDDDNHTVVTIDNRFLGGAHPHACGGGTVHVCTIEPDTDFIAVRFNGGAVDACDIVDAKGGGTLEIDFLAHDPDGHLAYYTLHALYGENLQINLLSLPSATIAPLAASQAGPTYGQARSPAQGATAPTWHGGSYRLTITNLSEAFPITCCYALDLRAYKRTIVNCNSSFQGHANRSTYTLTVNT